MVGGARRDSCSTLLRGRGLSPLALYPDLGCGAVRPGEVPAAIDQKTAKPRAPLEFGAGPERRARVPGLGFCWHDGARGAMRPPRACTRRRVAEPARAARRRPCPCHGERRGRYVRHSNAKTRAFASVTSYCPSCDSCACAYHNIPLEFFLGIIN